MSDIEPEGTETERLRAALERIQLDRHGHPATALGTPVHPEMCPVCSFIATTLGYKPWLGRDPFAVTPIDASEQVSVQAGVAEAEGRVSDGTEPEPTDESE